MWTQTLPDILAEGGVVAAFQDSLATGDDTGLGTWSTGDFAVADQLVACAAAQHDIDPRRIYTAGCSAGGLQAAAFAVSRSNYVAAAMTNSGGQGLTVPSQRPSHVPAAMTVHGSKNNDIVIINFADASLAYDQALAQRGGFAVDCDHGGGHCGAPQTYVHAQWTFLKDHPFGVSPEPYASGLPAGFPSSCRTIGP
jgi:poly(3-hydroxybutyrate) depolymerase